MIDGERRLRVEPLESHIADDAYNRHPRVIRSSFYSDLLADRVRARPKSLGNTVADDADQIATSFVIVSNQAAALEPDAHSREVAGGHTVESCFDARLDHRLRAAFDCYGKCSCERRQ